MSYTTTADEIRALEKQWERDVEPNIKVRECQHGTIFTGWVDRPLHRLEYRVARQRIVDADGRAFTFGPSSAGAPLIIDEETGQRWTIGINRLVAMARADGVCELPADAGEVDA